MIIIAYYYYYLCQEKNPRSLQQPPGPAGSIVEINPLFRIPSQMFSASSWAHSVTNARPLKWASCITFNASSTVYPSTTLSSTCTTYSLLFTLSLWRRTRYEGGRRRRVSRLFAYVFIEMDMSVCVCACVCVCVSE